MAEFANRLKNMQKQAIYEQKHMTIKEFKERQKHFILFNKDEILTIFEWMASSGAPKLKHFFEFWGEDSENIPNAENITKQLFYEVFNEYGISVDNLKLTRNGQQISVTLEIK